MAKSVLWFIVICIYIGLYQASKNHVPTSRWGVFTLIGIVCFIAIIELVEKWGNRK